MSDERPRVHQSAKKSLADRDMHNGLSTSQQVLKPGTDRADVTKPKCDNVETTSVRTVLSMEQRDDNHLANSACADQRKMRPGSESENNINNQTLRDQSLDKDAPTSAANMTVNRKSEKESITSIPLVETGLEQSNRDTTDHVIGSEFDRRQLASMPSPKILRTQCAEETELNTEQVQKRTTCKLLREPIKRRSIEETTNNPSMTYYGRRDGVGARSNDFSKSMYEFGGRTASPTEVAAAVMSKTQEVVKDTKETVAVLRGEFAYKAYTEPGEAGNCVLQDGAYCIAIKVVYSAGDPLQRRKDNISFPCGIDDYFRWMFCLRSKHYIKTCNTRFEKSGNVTLLGEPDPHIRIETTVKNKSHSEQVALTVIKHAVRLVGQEVIVKCINADENVEIERTYKTTDTVFEHKDGKCYLVCARCDVDKIEATIPNISVERNENITKRFVLPRACYKFKSIEEGILKHKSVTLEVQIQKENTTYIVTGTADKVQQIDRDLKIIEKQMKKRESVITGISCKQSLGELDIEKDLDDMFSKSSLHCVVEARGQTFYVIGFDDRTIGRGCIEVGKVIVEKNILLVGNTRTRRDEIMKLLRSKELPLGKVSIHLDISACRVYIVGLKPFVEETVKSVQATIDIFSDQRKSENEQRSQTNVATGIKHTVDILPPRAVTQDMAIHDEKYEEFLLSKHGKQFIGQLESNYNVHIDLVKGDARKNKLTQVRRTDESDLTLWRLPNKKKLVLHKCRIENSKGKVLVMYRPSNSDRPNISTRHNTDQSTFVDVAIPDYANGRQADLKKLFGEVFTTAKEEKVETIALSVEPIEGWTFPAFSECLVDKTVEFLTQLEDKDFPRGIALCTNDQKSFQHTQDAIQNRFTIPDHTTQIKIVEGKLDQTEVDVIVNTTSTNLDLDHGAVSRAILRKAGPRIQRECFEKYQCGIRHGDIAVTKGYGLNCKHVIHVSLQNYTEDDEMQCIRALQMLTSKCLKWASMKELTSIAFPAFGTGVLKYPVKLVAGEMFSSVELFKSENTNTTLRTVLFVIYPKDRHIIEAFRKIENSLLVSTKEPPPEARLSITLKGDEHGVKTACQELKHTLAGNEEYSETLTIGATDYAALTKLYRNEIESCKDITFKHNRQEEDGKLCLTGKRKHLEPFVQVMKSWVTVVTCLKKTKLRLKNSIPKGLFRNINGIFCFIENQIHGLLTLYSDSTEKLSEARSLLQDFIFVRNEDTNRTTGEELHVESIPTKSKVANPRQITKGPKPKTQFSWSTSTSNMKVYKIGSLELLVYEADILNLPVDCIVNAANADLKHCGGIAYEIAKHAGKILEDESVEIIKKHSRLRTGAVVQTSAGNLPYASVLHAVGPSWYDYKTHEDDGVRKCLDDLENTLLNCFNLAQKNKIHSIALPSISSGLFHVPKELCAVQYAKAVLQFANQRGIVLQKIHFVDVNREMINLIHDVFGDMIELRKPTPYDWKKFVSPMPLAGTRGEQAGLTDKVNHQQRQVLNSSTQMKSSVENDSGIPSYHFADNMLKCNFGNEINIVVQVGDIVSLQGVQALVCGENRTGMRAGEIARHLWNVGGDKYKREKNHAFQTARNFGDVIPVTVGDTNYRTILHVVVPKKDQRALHQTYCNIFNMAGQLNLRSLAITIIGTGTGHFDVNTSATILIDEWEHFCQTMSYRGLTLHVVLVDNNVASEVAHIFKSCIDNRQHTVDVKLDSSAVVRQDNRQVSVKDISSEKRCQMSQSVNDSTDTQQPSSSKLPELSDPRVMSDAKAAEVKADADDDCVICMDEMNTPKTLRCGHRFCTQCIDNYFKVKPACPSCGVVCGIIMGDQPDGTMVIGKIKPPLSDYDKYETIVMAYRFPPGVQGKQHPRPGGYYDSVSRVAYLPDTDEGRNVCAMMKIAFERRLVFTIGTSRTTGQEGVITWNDIHHKTDTRPNHQFGYPDPTYLQRVSEELAIKGVTEADIEKKVMKHLQKSATEMTRITVTTLKEKK